MQNVAPPDKPPAAPDRRAAMGKAARARVLKEHTFRHRAQQLKQIIESYL